MDLQVAAQSETIKRDTVRTNVRFTPDQHTRIRQDSLITGESIPTLLKNSYFNRKPIRVLMNVEDRKTVFAELRRISNNANQVARRVNSGLMEGWYPEFSEVAQHLARLEAFLVGIYGVR